MHLRCGGVPCTQHRGGEFVRLRGGSECCRCCGVQCRCGHGGMFTQPEPGRRRLHTFVMRCSATRAAHHGRGPFWLEVSRARPRWSAESSVGPAGAVRGATPQARLKAFAASSWAPVRRGGCGGRRRIRSRARRRLPVGRQAPWPVRRGQGPPRRSARLPAPRPPLGRRLDACSAAGGPWRTVQPFGGPALRKSQLVVSARRPPPEPPRWLPIGRPRGGNVLGGS